MYLFFSGLIHFNIFNITYKIVVKKSTLALESSNLGAHLQSRQNNNTVSVRSAIYGDIAIVGLYDLEINLETQKSLLPISHTPTPNNAELDYSRK